MVFGLSHVKHDTKSKDKQFIPFRDIHDSSTNILHMSLQRFIYFSRPFSQEEVDYKIQLISQEQKILGRIEHHYLLEN